MTRFPRSRTSCVELVNADVYLCRTHAAMLANTPKLSRKPTDTFVLRFKATCHNNGIGRRAQNQSMPMLTAVVA
jgi:hypothetical protein